MQVARNAAKPAAPAQIDAKRQAVADGLRAAGEGVNQGFEHMAVVAEKGYIYPVESAYATGKAVGSALNKALPNQPIAGKIGKTIFDGMGFIAAFHGMIIGGALRAPGDIANDVAHGIADRIDGKDTNNQTYGIHLPGVGK